MRVKILWVFTIIVTIIVSWYAFKGRLNGDVRLKENVNMISLSNTGSDSDNKNTVENYLKAVISNDQNKVLSVLSGEALQTTSLNYKAHRPVASSLELVSFSLDTISINTDNTFSIINATVIYSKNEVLNQQLYRFYLSKPKDVWKIFKIEARQIEPPASLSPGDLNGDIKDLIADYVKTSFTGNNSQHNNFLTGPALSAQSMVNNSFGNYKMTGFKVDNLTMKNVGSAPGYYLVRASVDVTKPVNASFKKEKRTVLLEIVRINDQWKINHLYLEGVEPIG